MTELEDRLRGALRVEIDVPDLLADVHRGAARRRARRTAGVAAATAAATVAAIGLVVSLGQDSTTNRPAPPITQPPAGVVDVAAGGDQVFALTPDTVWLRDDQGWKRLHDFGIDTLEYLVVAPDGRNAWAWGPKLWSTHDGGTTWKITRVPGDLTFGHRVAVVGDFVWVQTGDRDGVPQYHRSPVDDDAWTWADANEGDLVPVEGALAFEKFLGEDTSSPVLRVAPPEGGAVRTLPLPCSGENQVIPAGTEVFVLCPRGADGATVHRTSGLERWEVFGTTTGVVTDVEALSPDALLVVGDGSATLVTPTGNEAVSGELGEGAWGVATVGETSYLAGQDGRLLVSHDGGVTWAQE